MAWNRETATLKKDLTWASAGDVVRLGEPLADQGLWNDDGVLRRCALVPLHLPGIGDPILYASEAGLSDLLVEQVTYEHTT